MQIVLRRALTRALKARDAPAIAALRSAVSAIANAEAGDATFSSAPGVESAHVAGSVLGLGAADVQRRPLTEENEQALVQAEATERLSAAEQYERLGRSDRAAQLRAEAAVLARHLPGR